MSRIYWDTMLFIYWLENNPEFAKRASMRSASSVPVRLKPCGMLTYAAISEKLTACLRKS